MHVLIGLFTHSTVRCTMGGAETSECAGANSKYTAASLYSTYRQGDVYSDGKLAPATGGAAQPARAGGGGGAARRWPPCRKSGALEQLLCGRASVAATGRNWCGTGLRTHTV